MVPSFRLLSHAWDPSRLAYRQRASGRRAAARMYCGPDTVEVLKKQIVERMWMAGGKSVEKE